MKTSAAILVAITGVQMCLMTATAQPTAVDTFNEYANGSSLSGLNGGSGWSSAWANNGAVGQTVQNGVLTTSGAAGGIADWRYFASPVSISASTTYYFRADLGINDSSDSSFWADALTDGNGSVIAQLALVHNYVTSYIGGGNQFSGNTIGYTPNGSADELLGELQWSGSSLSLSVWVTPASSPLPTSQAAAGSPIWVQTGTAPSVANIGGVLLQSFSSPGVTTAANLYFGPTWESVTAVPEPGMLALLGLGGLLLTLRRSR